MPAIQTTYGLTHDRFIEGMIPDMRSFQDFTAICETAAGIGFGKVVVKGTADNQGRISEASRAFRGIAVLKPETGGTLANGYSQYAEMRVRRKGPVVVIASVQVAQEDPVYFVPATGLLTNVSNSSANTLIPGATWDTATTGTNQLAILLLG